jgi:acetylornithine deacetylase
VHSSRVDIGVPAVMVAGKLIAWHDDVMAENKAKAEPGNPFEPPYSTLHVGVVEGGTAVNITAEHCAFSHEVRVVPGDATDYVARYRARIAELEAGMKAIAPETGIVMEITSQTPPLAPERDGAAETLARRLTGDNASHVVAYGTEGGLFQAAGWSTVVCGPGDIAQAHQPDEFITLAQLDAGTAFVRALIAELAR